MIYKKILQVQSAVSPIAKNAKVKDRSGRKIYDGILADDVTIGIRQHMIDAGVVCEVTVLSHTETQTGNKWRASVEIQATFVDADDPDGHKIISRMVASADDQQDKALPKAITMATKHAYIKTFMLRTGLNDEERVYDAPQKQPQSDEKITPSQSIDLTKKVTAMGMAVNALLKNVNQHLGREYESIDDIKKSDYQLILRSLQAKVQKERNEKTEVMS